MKKASLILLAGFTALIAGCSTMNSSSSGQSSSTPVHASPFVHAQPTAPPDGYMPGLRVHY